MKHRQPYHNSVYRSLVLITQMGINMVVTITMATALGIWLDRKLGTSFLVVVLFFIGAAAGAQNCYRMARRIYTDRPGEQTGRTQERKPDKTDGSLGDIKKKK